MNWIKNFVRPKIRNFLGARFEVAENMWVKDPDSGQMVFHRDLEANQFVVPTSGFHMHMPPAARLQHMFDGGEYVEIANPAVTAGLAISSYWPPSNMCCRRAAGGMRM